MSSRSFLNYLAKFQKNCFCNGQTFVRGYSKKVNNSNGPFKIVKGRKPEAESTDLVWRDPSFELLASNGFPLFLRGNIGLAWYDTQTTLKTHHELIMEQIDDSGESPEADMILRVQTCPTVLRQTVCELFPYRTLEKSELSVITINLKPDLKQVRSNKEVETERMAQTFLITAKNICSKLRNNGYWADFINPFSGRPYLVPTGPNELYKTDEKFRCLDFQIFDIEECKIISNEGSVQKRFIGSLFTNAPCNKHHLNEIFTSPTN
ncbi:methylmalonic aciduria and homocystinuria type D homolog, mitochondrial-like [Sitophilus oryzae]|uniref:Methylmalonic aciduria and homocystinuria type D homolog, mitochondrial-like n=1 Tax=Sitophilus oryzae TaxID=7048 RepID=A0A6J2XPG3_SITOR|nr:methylmalonic aciduria and homocystinuria type D homolog, mitochondrial-like [Sitophilus oryzae]